MFNAANGRNIKLGGPSISDTNGTQNVSISYNTLYNANQNVSANLTGLTTNTTYHYRLVATNAQGTTMTGDKTFTTGQPAPGQAPTPLLQRGRLSRPSVAPERRPRSTQLIPPSR